ncbi:MAG: carbohydrate ABC transporter permease [Eubacteriales bacterium]|nr:carbohydrate ABC transporter permease [Eubacteriales bacterium]
MSGMKRRQLWGGIAAQAAALALGLIIIFPIVYGILGAFKSPAEFSAYPPTFWPKSFAYTQNFSDAFARVPFLRFGFNSLVVALIGTVIRLLFAILAAFAFAFYDFRLKNALFLVVLATMMLPGDTLLVTNYLTVSRLRLLDSYLGMAITSFVGATQMFMLRQSFLTFPRELKDAGQMDGCGDLRFLATILLPISKPVLVTLFVQSFVTMWNAYLWPLLVTNSNHMRTIQVGITMITSFEDTNYHLVLAGVALSLIPAFLLFIILRRNIQRNMTAGALVG